MASDMANTYLNILLAEGNKHLIKKCFDTFCDTHEEMLTQIKTIFVII